MTNSVRSYRTSAIEGATHIDILIATYDAMAEDLRLAGEAAASGDIAARCRHSQHALLLLGHLESWVSLLDDAVLQNCLVRFYAYLRSELLRIQALSDADSFSKLAMTICETRAAWQQKQSQSARQVETPSPEIQGPEAVNPAEDSRFCWSA